MLRAANVSGVFSVEEKHELLNIRRHHRAADGIRWRTGKCVCTVPGDTAVRKSANAKGSYLDVINTLDKEIVVVELSAIVER